ncbi:hypothetical protein AZI11_13140 (plasmid) [Levilactobacillus brevis]|uniref:hypothetical protein n=1 Tax=Levilactobacillus brevis TaxID=1580 RepID=UPI000A204241|nr:hypothetical protein [Levilactobacillus brevis]ARN93880.1 hypothetical protein AZI11_13140 [Levilactobacillus brevis]ARN96417.1 hypothetical protein AZI12_13015 [Levilactobacillus brevis]
MMKMKLTVAVAAFVGMLGFGAVAPVHADTATKVSAHYPSRVITYHIDSKSNYYRNLWKQAVNVYHDNGAFVFKNTSRSKAKLRMTSVKTNPSYPFGYGDYWVDSFQPHVITKSRVVISRDGFMSETDSHAQRIAWAAYLIGGSIGMQYTNKASGITSSNNEIPQLSNGDKLGLVKAYKHLRLL